MRRVAIFALLVLVLGCTRTVIVPGPGKTYQDLATDRYECMKECTHRGWGFNAGSGFAGGWGGERVNEDEFYACMLARGHRLGRENKITGNISER